MPPAEKHVDVEMITEAIRKANGSWMHKALFGALLANIAVIMYCVGVLMVNHRLLQDALRDIKENEMAYHAIDKELAETKVTVRGHEVRITSLECSKTRN